MEGKHREFYATSLKYLGCTELEDLTKEEQAKHAYFLALAAILGDKVRGFLKLPQMSIWNDLLKLEDKCINVVVCRCTTSGSCSPTRCWTV